LDWSFVEETRHCPYIFLRRPRRSPGNISPAAGVATEAQNDYLLNTSVQPPGNRTIRLHQIEVSKGHRQPTKCHPRKKDRKRKRRKKKKNTHTLSILNMTLIFTHLFRFYLANFNETRFLYEIKAIPVTGLGGL
jgi:hypothetical protein